MVSDVGNHRIAVFRRDDNGAVAEQRVIVGNNNGTSFPPGICTSNNELYLATGGKISVFPSNATGDVAPSPMPA